MSGKTSVDHVVSAAASLGTGGTYWAWLTGELGIFVPIVVGLLSIIWFSISIYETKTFKHLIGKE